MSTYLIGSGNKEHQTTGRSLVRAIFAWLKSLREFIGRYHHRPLRQLIVLSSLFLIGCGGISKVPEPVRGKPEVSKVEQRELGLVVKQMLIPKGVNGRHRTRSMRPRYITIHSTQNRARSANARMHAIGMYQGNFRSRYNSLGYLAWHYTVDDGSIYQSLPTYEQGQHADYEGPGNRSSIGIEMCENRGNHRGRTVDRTARLTASLMKEHGIPLGNVVPHQHWHMKRFADGKDLGHKNCPHFLLNNGQRGPKWNQFLAKVNYYHRQL